MMGNRAAAAATVAATDDAAGGLATLRDLTVFTRRLVAGFAAGFAADLLRVTMAVFLAMEILHTTLKKHNVSHCMATLF